MSSFYRGMVTCVLFAVILAALSFIEGFVLARVVPTGLWVWFGPFNATLWGFPLALAYNGLAALLTGFIAARYVRAKHVRVAAYISVAAYILMAVLGYARIHVLSIVSDGHIVHPAWSHIVLANARLAAAWIPTLFVMMLIGLRLGSLLVSGLSVYNADQESNR